jgi:hypothetical protein
MTETQPKPQIDESPMAYFKPENYFKTEQGGDPLPWLEDCPLPDGAVIEIRENDKTPIVPGMILELKDELFIDSALTELAERYTINDPLPSRWQANIRADNYTSRNAQHDWHAQSPKEKARHYWLVLKVTAEDSTGDQGIEVAAVMTHETNGKRMLNVASYEHFVLSIHRAKERNHGKALPSFYFANRIDIEKLEQAGFDTRRLLAIFEHDKATTTLSAFVDEQRKKIPVLPASPVPPAATD